MIVHDYGIVYLGDKFIQILDRTTKTEEIVKITQNMIEENGTRLRILVEASGHINFAE